MQTTSSQTETERGNRQRFISRQELRTLKGIAFSDATLYRKIKGGTFPPPVKLGDNTNAWPEVEIDEWGEQRIAERDSMKGAA